MTTPVITEKADASITDAARKMTDNDIECLVITDINQSVIGILTFRDLVEKILLSGRSPRNVKVGEAMTSRVKTARSTATVMEAIKMMKKHRLRRIPVIDEEERLVGIVTNFDLACLGLSVSV